MTYRCMEEKCGKVFSLSTQYLSPYVICPHCKSKLVVLITQDMPINRKWWEKKDDITDR